MFTVSLVLFGISFATAAIATFLDSCDKHMNVATKLYIVATCAFVIALFIASKTY
jgi:hypothetical protein